MAYENISYKSYCWSLGTTSFRTKNFNYTIEKQLLLLDEFWNLEENKDASWNSNNELQSKYYDFMKEKEFVTGDARNKPKDAREKTSGLKDIGLITEDRKLSAVGRALLEINKNASYEAKNGFEISEDSYIYLKQMLKTSSKFDDEYVRPFIVLLYLLSKHKNLSVDEFTYLLPLCINESVTHTVSNEITSIRAGEKTVDDVIVHVIFNMDNYKSGLKLLLDNEVSENLICTVGFNRKSRKFDRPYYALYNALKSVFVDKNNDDIIALFDTISGINIKTYWKNLLFSTTNKRSMLSNPIEYLNENDFSNIENEEDLKIVFYKYMHLFKAKATLKDYFDLNRRYIKTTDTVIFEDNKVKLDIVPKHFFESKIEELFTHAFTECSTIYDNCKLDDIASCLKIDSQEIIMAVRENFGEDIYTINEAKSAIERERYSRLHKLIDTKFSDEILIELLEHFEERNDSIISELVTDNADIPTIFEYILGIIWYKVSDRQGNILDYMKLSLEADLLPRTHAGGGEADIVYEYDKTETYPEHSLLIEATLSNATTQRSMEMEPVSRHLGNHLLKTKNLDSYCIFITNNLDINVISDFRGRKTMTWYDRQDNSNFIEGMKIIPIEVNEIKTILRNSVNYEELYTKFDEAYKSDIPIHEWYSSCIRNS